KEALLAWYFLRTADGPLTADQLDERIEAWFHDRWDLGMDFEVGDGVDKLRELRLAKEADGERLAAVPLDEAMCRLDARWDQYFQYDR
ncbi:MAG: TMEM143 family protein, partial [Egibacteraceae bacterium]